MTEQELRAELKSRDFKRFYLVYGDDTYLKNHYANAIVKTAVGDTLPDMNLLRLEGAKISMQQLSEAVEQLPVMTEYRGVIIRDLNINDRTENEIKDFKTIINELPDTTVAVLLLDTVEVDKQGKWISILKLAEKVGAVVNFNYKTESAIIRILIDSAAKRGTTLDTACARYLVQCCGRDLRVLQGELDKLCAYKKGGRAEREDIDRLCVKTPDASRYRLPDAILSQNVSGALRLIDELLDMRLSEIEIMAVINSSFTDIYRVKAAISAGVKPTDIAEEFGYSKKREFVLQNASPHAKRLSNATLLRCLTLLDNADKELKSSVANSKLTLEKTVIMLIEALRGRTA